MFDRDRRVRGIFASLIDSALFVSRVGPLREAILKVLTPVVRSSIMLAQQEVSNRAILADKTDMMLALIHSTMRSGVHKKTVRIMMKKIFFNRERKLTELKFLLKNGFRPPSFITISPGKRCNLKCKYCYANATTDEEKLSHYVFSRIILEAKKFWGTRFFVISGGEPLLWQDAGMTVLDIAKANLDTIFLVYTNGTLINGDVLNQLYEYANILPAISIEGLKTITDERRGKGIFERVSTVMRELKKRNIAFGISMTATRENCEELLSDETISYYFEELGASFGWIFHYMPIGRDPVPELMPTPEQREWMWQRTWEIIRKKKILLADFWNHGTVSNGCISSARSGGYFYIDWNGNITPCVFFPYTTMNINRLYEDGKTINAIFEDEFFLAIRCWQRDYGYKKTELIRNNDWLRPCPIRDHHKIARMLIKRYNAVLIDGNDPGINCDDFIKSLEDYDRRLADRIGPLWEDRYVQKG